MEIKKQLLKKINFQVNKDIADHPHFHRRFLKLVSEFEDSKNIICSHCRHKLFDHVKSGQIGYCQICYDKGNKECRTLKRYFKNKIQKIK